MTDEKEQGGSDAQFDEQLQRQKQEKKIEESDPIPTPPRRERRPKP